MQKIVKSYREYEADGKETKKGREIMSESFERLADKVAEERAEQTTVNNIRLIMKNFKCSLGEALDALEIKGKDRAIIAIQLRKSIRKKVSHDDC